MLRDDHLTDVREERERALVETSAESFDRIAFAQRALDIVRLPAGTTVAVCEGLFRVHVSSGRDWRTDGARWATLFVPPRASRRAIALAVAELATREHAPYRVSGEAGALPYALDVLLAQTG